MGVIERTWIGTGRDYRYGKSTTTNEYVAARWREANCEVEGPYVHADLHQGAVDALDAAIKAARTFNRNGMTWQEYDRKLAELEQFVNRAREQSR